jgi:hypothetical protein
LLDHTFAPLGQVIVSQPTQSWRQTFDVGDGLGKKKKKRKTKMKKEEDGSFTSYYLGNHFFFFFTLEMAVMPKHEGTTTSRA